MSDEAEHEHEQGVPQNCNVPGCCFHTLMNARIRTLVQDDENYVNVHDVSMWLINWHAVQMRQLQDQMVESGIPPHAFHEAMANHIASAQAVVSVLHEMHEYPVADHLNSTETYLVTPAAMKDVPDTVPTEWIHDKETQ